MKNFQYFVRTKLKKLNLKLQQFKRNLRPVIRPQGSSHNERRTYERVRSVGSGMRRTSGTGRKEGVFIKKAFFAVCILALVMVLNVLPSETSKNMTGWVKQVLNTSLDLDEWSNFGEIKRVSVDLIKPMLSGWIEDSENGHRSEELRFQFPANGNIIPSFEVKGDDKLTNGILIEAMDNVIHASQKGTVINIVKSKIYGDTIVIEHDDGYITTYDLVSEVSVSVGTVVEKYQDIGTADQFFYFQVIKNGEYLDFESVAETNKTV